MQFAHKMNNNSIATMKVILSALIGSVTLDSIINSKYSAFAIPSTGDSRTVLYPITGKESPSQLLGYVKNSAGKSVTGHLSCPPGDLLVCVVVGQVRQDLWSLFGNANFPQNLLILKSTILSVVSVGNT